MIPIYKPFMPENISDKINEILYSGKLSYGEIGKEFEQSLSDFISNDKILTTTTYNQALLMALSVLDLKAGDEIIASPVSCLASNQPFAVKDLKINWVDVDPTSGTIDTEHLRKLISGKTKAIFNNLFCGYAGELDDVYQLGTEFNIPVVDDCIEAFGTEYKGKKTGNTGADITIFSFQTVRLPNTIDGGALSFKDNKLYEKARMIRDYGIDRSNFRLQNGEINPDCDITLEGYGATMSEINSLIGTEQMKNVTKLLEKQRNNGLTWNKIFDSDLKIQSLKVNENVNPNFWVYGLLTDNKNEFLQKMKADGFYSTGVHINNNVYSVFHNKTELVGVNEFMSKYVAVPSGWWFTR